MVRIEQRLITLCRAIKTLQKAIEFFCEYEVIVIKIPTEKKRRILLGLRDSIIHRFEYSSDLFLTVLAEYLEDIEKSELETLSPRSVLRAAVTTRVITEREGLQGMAMIECRSKTSQAHHEEIAQEIAQDIPAFYQFIKTITDRIQKKIVTQ